MTKFELTLIIVVGGILGLIAEISITDSVRYVKYDCKIAEISPDFPIEVKQRCRELMKQGTK